MATDHHERQSLRDFAMKVHRAKIMAEGLFTCHEFMSLVKSIKVLGHAVLKKPLRVHFLAWKRLSNADGQNMTIRNSVKEVYDISNFTGRDMIHCLLQSGVVRWISLDLAMTYHRSAAKVASWLEKYKPDDPRITPKSKEQKRKLLEDRANEVQGRYSLSARRSMSRKNSPAKAVKSPEIIQDSPVSIIDLPETPDNLRGEVRKSSRNVQPAEIAEVEDPVTPAMNVSATEAMEDAQAHSAIANARIQELEQQLLRQNKSGDVQVSNKTAANSNLRQVASEVPGSKQIALGWKPGQSRSDFLKNRCSELSDQLQKQHPEKIIMLTDEQVNAQAAESARAIISARTAAADEEAKLLVLEDALVRAVGKAAASPGKSQGKKQAGQDTSFRIGERVTYLRTGEKAFICEVHRDDPGEVYYTFKGADSLKERQTTADLLEKFVEDAEVDSSDEEDAEPLPNLATESDAELLASLALIEEAKLKSQARCQGLSAADKEDHWRRLGVAQDTSKNNSALPAPTQDDGVNQGTWTLFAEANANGSDVRWKDALLKQVQQMQDKLQIMEEKEADAQPGQHNVMAQDRAQVELYERVDAFVTLIASEHTETAQSLKRCIDRSCTMMQQLGAKWCPCGAPRSTMDLKCHNTGCRARVVGPVEQCLQQEECLACFHNHLWSKSVNKKERAKALHALSALPKFKFDSDPPDKLAKLLVTIYKICEMDDAVTMLTRASNPEHNRMIGEGLITAKAILEAILYGCTASSHQVLGEAVDFIVSARALLAMLKGFTMGNLGEDDSEFFTFHATELKSKSKVSLEKSKISWTKASMQPPKAHPSMS